MVWPPSVLNLEIQLSRGLESHGAKQDGNVGPCCGLETTSVLPCRSSGYDWFVARCGEIESAENLDISCTIHFDIAVFIYKTGNTTLSPGSDIN